MSSSPYFERHVRALVKAVTSVEPKQGFYIAGKFLRLRADASIVACIGENCFELRPQDTKVGDPKM